jgi:hypothetical protein
MDRTNMKAHNWFKTALTLMALSSTLQAGNIDLYGLGWSGSIGDGVVQGTYTGYYDDFAPPVYAATQTVVGGNLDASGAVTVATLEAGLGLSLGRIGGLDPTLGVTNGSAVYYDISAAEGDTLCIALNFVANDAWPFDDFAFFSASLEDDEFSYLEMLGRIDVMQSGGVGDFGSSGYHTFNYTFTADGTYRLGFGVANAVNLDLGTIDDAGISDSALLLAPAPEPSSWLLAGSAILAVALLRRRRTAKAL